MKEYCIVIQHGSAKPYSLWTFSTFESCYQKLIELIQEKCTQIRNEYYVINDFFKNTYPAFLSDITKYTIKVREVSEWQIYSEKNNMHKMQKTNNIIKLFG